MKFNFAKLITAAIMAVAFAATPSDNAAGGPSFIGISQDSDNPVPTMKFAFAKLAAAAIMVASVKAVPALEWWHSTEFATVSVLEVWTGQMRLVSP
ncbi:hypothetical protein C8J56DRAFT_1046757 [Mycena floridula]|nr:hypothetical protein C8J56DRAFT_1046757 [Mycena floridula]